MCLFEALDYLHTECHVIHTGALAQLCLHHRLSFLEIVVANETKISKRATYYKRSKMSLSSRILRWPSSRVQAHGRMLMAEPCI